MGRFLTHFCVLTFVLFCSITFFAEATEEKPKRTRTTKKQDDSAAAYAMCAQMLQSHHPEGDSLLSQSEATLAALTEEYSLLEFFTQETGKAFHSPLLAMSAAQRGWAIVNSQPTSVVASPFSEDGKVVRYELISGGVKEVGGLRIVGQLDGIAAIMGLMRAKAEGDRAGRAIPFIVGAPGAGKSEIIKILRTAFTRLPLVNPKYFLYTFKWTNLEQIEGLQGLISTDIEHRSPMNENPIALLPEALQEAYVHAMKSEITDIIQMDPAPKTTLQPMDEFLRTTILRHYAKLAKKSELSISEAVAALNRHIRVIRLVPNQQSVPILTAQGKNVEYASLFFQKNAIVHNLYGPAHPLAHHYNGLVPGANGFALFADEFLKNPDPLQKTFLNVFEDQSIAQGGVGTVPVDTFYLAATNTVDVEEHNAENPQSPLMDRMSKTSFNYPINPFEAQKILLYEMENMWARTLDTQSGSDWFQVTGEVLDDLVPDPKPGERPTGTDGRYRIELGHPDKPGSIHISPHALLYLSLVGAVSRMNFDQAQAEELANFPIVGTPIFRNPITRLQAIMGLSEMTAAQRSHLRQLSLLLNEGTFGLTSRKAKEVFQDCRLQARENKTLSITPSLVLKVIKNRMLRNQLGLTHEDGTNLLRFGQSVLVHFTVPAFQRDINNALLGPNNNAALATIYDEVIQELVALHRDATATDYETKSSGRKRIDFNRLQEIKEIYKEQNGQPLIASEVALFELERQSRADDSASAEQMRNAALLQAIAHWQGRKITAGVDASLGTILSVGLGQETGTPDQQERAQTLMQELRDRYGYNEHSAMEALQLVSDEIHRSSR